jgi:hypothetical protein
MVSLPFLAGNIHHKTGDALSHRTKAGAEVKFPPSAQLDLISS